MNKSMLVRLVTCRHGGMLEAECRAWEAPRQSISHVPRQHTPRLEPSGEWVRRCAEHRTSLRLMGYEPSQHQGGYRYPHSIAALAALYAEGGARLVLRSPGQCSGPVPVALL